MSIEEESKKYYDWRYNSFGWGMYEGTSAYQRYKDLKREIDRREEFNSQYNSDMSWMLYQNDLKELAKREEELKRNEWCRNPDWVDHNPYVEPEWKIQKRKEEEEKERIKQENIKNGVKEKPFESYDDYQKRMKKIVYTIAAFGWIIFIISKIA